MAITIPPFGVIATKEERKNKVLMNHEGIHLKQGNELFVIPFLILYVSNFFWLLFRFFDSQKAYLGNLFESEAYANAKNLKYLKTRKRFSWVKSRQTNITKLYRKNVFETKTSLGNIILPILLIIIVVFIITLTLL
jgi:hypothetical protein